MPLTLWGAEPTLAAHEDVTIPAVFPAANTAILGARRFLKECAMIRRAVIGSWCAVSALLAGVAAPAMAQDAVYARNLAATCFTCHGTDGRSVGGVPPGLAGRDKGELLQTLKDFKAGKRPATLMHQQAKGYTDQQLELIAGYFAGTKPGPAAAAPVAR
jgi:cytochrome c553